MGNDMGNIKRIDKITSGTAPPMVVIVPDSPPSINEVQLTFGEGASVTIKSAEPLQSVLDKAISTAQRYKKSERDIAEIG